MIHKAALNLEYATAASAVRCNTLIEGIFNTHILPELEKAISLNIPEGIHFELSKLEINIGEINEKDLTEQLAAKIGKSLSDALKNISGVKQLIDNGYSISGDPIFGHDLLQSIDIYFQRGYFRKNSNQLETIDELVTKAIGHYRKELIEMLKKYSRQNEILKRIAASLSPQTFELLIKPLEPAQENWIIEFSKTLTETKIESNLNQISSSEFRQKINYAILKYILNMDSSGFSKTKFADLVLAELALNDHSIQVLTGAFKKQSNSTSSLLSERLSHLTEEQSKRKSGKSKEPDIDELLELLNSGTLYTGSNQAELLKTAILQAIRNPEKKRKFIQKLRQTGIRKILELLSGKQADSLFELISTFPKSRISTNNENASRNELALQLASYLSQGKFRTLNTEELIVFLIYSSGFDFSETIRSTEFRSFIQKLKTTDAKKIQRSIEEEHRDQEISAIQQAHQQSLKSGQTKKEIQAELALTEASFLITKKKIIGHYLRTGQLPEAFSDLSKSDIQAIFNELILRNDDFLAHHFRHTPDPDRFVQRLIILSGNLSVIDLETYFHLFFRTEFELFSRIRSLAGQAFYEFQFPENKPRFLIELFLSALAKSKSDSQNQIFLISILTELSTLLGNASGEFIPSLHLDSGIPEIKSALRKQIEIDFEQLNKSGLSIQTDWKKIAGFIKNSSFLFLTDQKSFFELLRKNKETLPLIFHWLKTQVNPELWKKMQDAISFIPELHAELVKSESNSEQILKMAIESKFDLSATLTNLNSSPELRKIFLNWLQTDEHFFEKFSSGSHDFQTSANFNSDSAQTIELINQLLSHPPKIKAVRINISFWKSLVFRFGIQQFMKSEAGTTANLAQDFLNLLLQKLKEINEEELFYPILEELKSSQLRELAEVAGTRLLIESTEKITFAQQADETKNPSESIRQILSLLRFYAENGYFPWWAGQVSFPELISELSSISRIHPIPFEKTILHAQHEPLFRNLLLTKLPQVVIQELTLIFENHPDLKSFRDEIIQENKKSIEIHGTSKAEFRSDLYHLDDDELFSKWFGQNPESKKMIGEYTALSGYFFFRNTNPGHWRKAVLKYPFEYFLMEPEKTNADFASGLLNFLTKKHPNTNWNGNLSTVYRLTNSTSETIKTKFPQAMIPHLNPENNQEASESENPAFQIEDGEEILIHNSGLILFWPFLTRLFEMLSLIENGSFVNYESKNRAVYILQHLVYNDFDFPEHELVLNKILTGMLPQQHLSRPESLSEYEISSTQSLLNGLISNWDKMKNTSPEGLQETFLRRAGILKFKSDSLTLVVENKGYDILLQSIPWNISMVKLLWMEKPLYVEWI